MSLILVTMVCHVPNFPDRPSQKTCCANELPVRFDEFDCFANCRNKNYIIRFISHAAWEVEKSPAMNGYQLRALARGMLGNRQWVGEFLGTQTGLGMITRAKNMMDARIYLGSLAAR